MGWKAKAFAGLLGLALFGGGAWPLGIVCLVYVALSMKTKHQPKKARSAPSRILRSRTILATFLFVLSAVALAAGGVLSPVVFFAGGGIALMWPNLVRVLRFGELTPVGDSVLLRSKYLPFLWCSVAELKPGAEQFPMAASALSGTLLVFTDTGKTYCAVTCRALGRKEAEARLLAAFRRASPPRRTGALLLPLDSEAAADLLALELSRPKSVGDYSVSIIGVSCLLVLECCEGKVRKAAAFAMKGKAISPAFPGKPEGLDAPPLTWEVFDAIGKHTRWPDPDPYSELVESMLATRGEPFAERLTHLESSGDRLTIRTLTGEDVVTTRPQLRAIISIYS